MQMVAIVLAVLVVGALLASFWGKGDSALHIVEAVALVFLLAAVFWPGR